VPNSIVASAHETDDHEHLRPHTATGFRPRIKATGFSGSDLCDRGILCDMT
jgi:hypothetical protein